MAKKGTLAYYVELLDKAYRATLATYVASIVLFWLYWVFSRHKHGDAWIALLAWGIIEVLLYYGIYFGSLPRRVQEKYGKEEA
ncbi:hypothetical protein EF808_01065 [archaeon]|nr:MAG: hypothetical protein EF808_01065 [archaeon]